MPRSGRRFLAKLVPGLVLLAACLASAPRAQGPAVRRATMLGRTFASAVPGRNSLQEQSRDGLAVTKNGIAWMLVTRDDGGSDRAERFHLELFYSSNEGRTWSLLGDLETKGDRIGAIAADPKKDVLHVLWSSTGSEDFQSVYYQQVDASRASFAGKRMTVLRGTSLVDDYSAEDVAVAADGTVVAGVHAGSKALAKNGLAASSVGICLLRPGAKEWSTPLRVSDRPARDLCLEPVGDAVHLLWREVREDVARHRAFDAANGSFVDASAHEVAFGAGNGKKLEPGLALCSDTAGNLYALAMVAGDKAGLGQVVSAFATGPGCAAWASSVLDEDRELIVQTQPPAFCVARGAGGRAIALWSRPDQRMRTLRARVLGEGKPAGETLVLADEKVGGPFLGMCAGACAGPDARAIRALCGLGSDGAITLLSVVADSGPAAQETAKRAEPKPEPKAADTKPVAAAEATPMAQEPPGSPQPPGAQEPGRTQQGGKPGKKPLKPLAGIYAERTDGRRRLATNRALAKSDDVIGKALAWLKKHQDEDGRFHVSAYTKHDAGSPCDGLGLATRELGVTALGLLAYLSDGSSLDRGPYQTQVTNAVDWLLHKQKPDGLLGDQDHEEFMLDHALATLALAEVAGMARNPEVRSCAQKAVDRLTAHRKEGGAFAKAPGGDDAETALTAWCLLALWTARDAELAVDPKALADAQGWLLLMTDPQSGRCAAGRVAQSEAVARKSFLAPPVESATGAALLCRALLGESTQSAPALRKGVAVVRNQQPEWADTRGKVDFEGWFFCAHALKELDQAAFLEWQERLVQTLLGAQRKSGTCEGSWDNEGDPFGKQASRIATTALGVLALAAPYRVARTAVQSQPTDGEPDKKDD